jgi:ethanolamine utilization protein EutA
VQLSGNTSYISDAAKLLPRRNLQVLQPQFACPEVIEPEKLAAAIRAHFTAFDIPDDAEVALALRWRGAPSHARLSAFAAGIFRALAPAIAAGRPLYIMLDGDVAQTLGAILREELGVASDILVIDGITLWDFDYIDLGRIRLPSRTVPVTIKSLVFSADPRAPHGHGHHHHGHGHSHHHDPTSS